MKAYPRERVKNILCRLGLSQVKGGQTGHEKWRDHRGRTCKPVFRRRDVSIAQLGCLGLELETQGIIDRKSFIQQIKLNSRR